MEIPRCNNAGIECYGRIPAYPPLRDPKGEKLLKPPKGEDARLEASDPETDNQPPH